MDRIAEWLATAAGLAWNYPVVILCLGAGLWFTLRLGFVQIRGFGHAIKVVAGKYDEKDQQGQLSHLQALSAAVSATVGLGNIAGVAIAVALGGPGAVLWMWIIGVLGMATKYVECGLGTVYREQSEDGTVRGGPMYYMRKGLGQSWAPMAGAFALFCMISSFGIGNMFQSNQAARGMDFYFDVPPWMTGAILVTLIGLVILGGIKRIGKVAGLLVPFMCATYVLGGLFICLANIDLLPGAFAVIFKDAFTGEAAAGGSIGTVIIWGVRRAIFSSEAGLGSAPIAHAAAKTDEPMRQGVVALLEPFIDTIVVCSITALVIVMSGYYGDDRILVLDEPMEGQVSALSAADYDDESGTLRLDHAPAPVYDASRRLNATHYRFDCVHEPHEGEGARKIEIRTLTEAGEEKARAVYILSAEAPEDLGDDEVHEACSGGDEAHQHMLAIPSAGKSDLFTVSILHHEAERAEALRAPSWEVREPSYVTELGGIELTTTAFDTFLPGFGNFFVSLAVLLFAFSTALSWSYYGETGAAYLLGRRAVLPFKIAFLAAFFMGALWALGPVMNFSDLMMALMAVPNILAILLLSKKVTALTSDYFGKLRRGEMDEPRISGPEAQESSKAQISKAASAK
ncbi:MAG: alanine/glycine:cation symporter family protein [Myxococcota bacterium]